MRPSSDRHSRQELYTQSGFLQLTIAGYAILAALVAFGGVSAYAYIQTQRLGVAQDSLANCREQSEILAGQIAKQNKAVDDLAKASQERQKQAKAALLAAGKGNVSKDAEIARLKALNAAGLTCSGAVSEVRKGLRK